MTLKNIKYMEIRMKIFFKLVIVLTLVCSFTLSFSGCMLDGIFNFSDSGNTGSGNGGDTGTNNGGNTGNGNGGSEDSGGNSENTDGDNNSDEEDDNSDGNGSTDDENSGGSDGSDENGGSGSDGGEDEEEDSIYLEDCRLPHFDYANVTDGKYNKELFYANDYDIGLGDPTVFYREESDGGWFYVTGTTTGVDFDLWKTKNFTNWSYIGKIYTPPANFFGEANFWAPQIMYDPDADHKYYLGEGSPEGKGLYILSFSAREASGMYRLAVTFSKEIEGPYTHFSGVNANGDFVDESTSCFEIEKLDGMSLYANHPYGDLYKARRGFIDASPYIDPVTGDKYLYMVRNRTVDKSNDVWGVKMIDWVTPAYATTTPLTTYGYTTIDKTEQLDFTTQNRIDEGPFLYYKDNTDDGEDNGKYYLTFSIGDTNDKLYPVAQAIGDSPLGPFTKIQPDDGGFIVVPGDLWDIHSSGHHCFFEAEGELFVGYHTYTINSDTTCKKRYFGMAKVEWVYNESGDYIMRANGPSKDVQPLPEASSEYENLAPDAECRIVGGDSENAFALTDGLIPLRDNDFSTEFKFNGTADIIFDFGDYVTARALVIYNSYDYKYSFDNIERVEFTYRKKISGKYYYGTAYIEDIGFNFEKYLIPQYYLLAKGETNMNQLRPMGAAIAEFDELEVCSVKITVDSTDRSDICRIGEIILLGKYGSAANQVGTSKKTPFRNYIKFGTDYSGNTTGDTVKPDGVLDEKVWTESKNVVSIAGVTNDSSNGEPIDVSVYGERSAAVYTYIDDKYVYFAFDVKDKNLFYHASKPQGRSTAVEIYLCASDIDAMSTGCYSIRINPIGDGEFKLGTYIPNSENNEWTAVSMTDKIRVGIKVNGTVCSSAPDDSYNRDENVGYTVEIAVDKSLVGMSADSLKFTAGFVQMKEYNEARMGNSFIEGTHYTTPTGWKTVTNEGIN